VPLAEELGVPGQLDVGTGRCRRDQPVGEPLRRADRHGRLADHDARPVQVRGQAVDHRVDEGQVRGVLALLLRRPDAQEVHVAERRHLGVRRGEAQPARLELLAQQRFEPGLVERDLTGAEQLDLGSVDVHAEHLEAELGHADRVGRPEVSSAEDGEAVRHAAALPARSVIEADGNGGGAVRTAVR
jgi:hypothetical protein